MPCYIHIPSWDILPGKINVTLPADAFITLTLHTSILSQDTYQAGGTCQVVLAQANLSSGLLPCHHHHALHLQRFIAFAAVHGSISQHFLIHVQRAQTLVCLPAHCREMEPETWTSIKFTLNQAKIMSLIYLPTFIIANQHLLSLTVMTWCIIVKGASHDL